MSALRAWDRFFFEPQPVAVAALVRIGWGVLVAAWALALLPDVDPFLTDGAMRYDRPLPAWSWNPLDGVGWRHAPLVACLLLVVSATCTAIGAWTRTATVVALVCLVALQRTNTTILNSGDLLIRLIGISLLLSPAGAVLSVDAARRARHAVGAAARPLRSLHGIRLLQLWIAVGYLLSAWAKLQGESWHAGTAAGWALRISDLQRFTPPEWLFTHTEVLNLITWGSLAFEAAFLFLVWNRRLRPWVLGAGVLFHLGIDLWLDVGFFGWAIFVAYLAFLPPEAAERITETLRRRQPEQHELAGASA